MTNFGTGGKLLFGLKFSATTADDIKTASIAVLVNKLGGNLYIFVL